MVAWVSAGDTARYALWWRGKEFGAVRVGLSGLGLLEDEAALEEAPMRIGLDVAPEILDAI